MERLTNKKEADAQRKRYKIRMEQGYPRNIPEERFLRLAAYEDTGLGPEEINALCEMDRRAKMAEMLRIEESAGVSIDRLAELAQADRDGRCVVVPVKLGQPVYCLQDYFNDATMKSEKRVKCRLVDFIPVASKMFETNGLIYQFSEIGKTVFLTREEAEAKLKEREKNG